MCGGSPLILLLVLNRFGFKVLFHVGEIHRRGDVNLILRSPLSLNRIVFFFCFILFHVGEIHRVALKLYSRSPLSEPVTLLKTTSNQFHVGEITQGRIVIL